MKYLLVVFIYLWCNLNHKLNWRPHVFNHVRMALSSLARIGRTLGHSWGLSPRLVMWAYKTLVLPQLEYGCMVWSGALSRAAIASELSKVQHLACSMVLSPFPGTATAVMEALLCLPSLPLDLKSKAVTAMYRLKVWRRWRNFDHGGRWSLNSHIRNLQMRATQC